MQNFSSSAPAHTTFTQDRLEGASASERTEFLRLGQALHHVLSLPGLGRTGLAQLHRVAPGPLSLDERDKKVARILGDAHNVLKIESLRLVPLPVRQLNTPEKKTVSISDYRRLG